MRYAVPAKLGHVVPEGPENDELLVFLMPLPDGPAQVLEGSAALIWLVAVQGRDDVPVTVAELTGCPPPEVEDEVCLYLDDLVRRGLLDLRG